MTRVAAVDCGTNTIRLLIADGTPSADVPTRLTDVVRRMEFVRLGQGIDATGRIAPAAMERTLTAAGEYAAQCVALQVNRVRFVATSASRDADNAQDFVAGVRTAFAAYDVSPEVITGAQEARLSFRGATGDLVRAGVPDPYLVIDLGGGSTEFVRGGRAVEAALSTDVGCVRMTERHLHSDPPTNAQITAATADVDAAIERADIEVGFEGVATLVGLAGSVTTIAAHALDLPAYDAAVIHGATLTVPEVLASCETILGSTRAERMRMRFMQEGRVDVIAAGALIWSRIVTRLATGGGLDTVRVSEADILDGIALTLLER